MMSGRHNGVSSIRMFKLKNSDTMMSSRSKDPKRRKIQNAETRTACSSRKNPRKIRLFEELTNRKLTKWKIPRKIENQKSNFFLRNERSTMTLFDEVKEEICFEHSKREAVSAFEKIPNRNRFKEEGTGKDLCLF